MSRATDRPWSVTPLWARWLPWQFRADLQSYRFDRMRPDARLERRWTLGMLATSLAYSLARPLVIGCVPGPDEEYNCSHCSRPILRRQYDTCSPQCARDQEAFLEEQRHWQGDDVVGLL